MVFSVNAVWPIYQKSVLEHIFQQKFQVLYKDSRQLHFIQDSTKLFLLPDGNLVGIIAIENH